MIDGGDIVISVKSKFVQRILAGEKVAELRRRAPRINPGCRIWIYSTAPEATVSARATVDRVVTGSPADIWNKYQDLCGVSAEEFDSYFSNADRACAIFLREIVEVSPRVPLREIRRRSSCFQPPQFFKRLHDGSPELALFRSRALTDGSVN
jgi:predicted transcriptional regulator